MRSAICPQRANQLTESGLLGDYFVASVAVAVGIVFRHAHFYLVPGGFRRRDRALRGRRLVRNCGEGVVSWEGWEHPVLHAYEERHVGKAYPPGLIEALQGLPPLDPITRVEDRREDLEL